MHAFVLALSRASVSSNFPEDEASFWQGSAGPITLAIEQLDNITFVLPTSDQVKSQKSKGKFLGLITFFLILDVFWPKNDSESVVSSLGGAICVCWGYL